VIVSYTLDSGVERHANAPDTFQIPAQSERESLKAGDLAKLIFRIEIGDEVHVERMWVQVSEVWPEFFVGLLDNDPFCTEEIRSGMRVEFHADHVIQIDHVA
jgi:uncharacterized protein YegJ (DUF2314 family)